MRGLMWICGLFLAACLSHHEAPETAQSHAALQLPTGQVRYLDQGEGEAIVLLHGFGAALETWGPMVENLSESHRVLALDARGFGLSTRADGDYSLAALADDVALAMHAVGIEHAVIVGHSWGSAVALVFALRHPDRADKLVLVDGLAYESQVPWAMRAVRTPGLGEFIVGTFFTAQFDAQLERAFYDPSILTFEQVANARSKMETPGSRAAALAVSRGIDLRPWQARYGEIDVPALVVWGKQDRILSPWWADRLASDLGRARVEIIDHCGHFPMLEAPERLASMLEEFMQ